MLFNKLADTWSWRNVSRGCASYRWPLSLTRARSTAIRLLVGNSADPEIVSTTPLAWPRDAQSRAEEGRSGSEREEEAGICERSRRKNIHGIGYRDFPRVIACFLSPRQLESRIRFSPIFASSGVCIIGWVAYRGRVGNRSRNRASRVDWNFLLSRIFHLLRKCSLDARPNFSFQRSSFTRNLKFLD